MTTTQKHRQFIVEPMGDKLVTAIAGIGQAYSARLEEKGYRKVNVNKFKNQEINFII